jgi:hypothetical protein
MDKNLISGHFWIFSHGGMTRRAADYLKIENFNLKNIYLKNIYLKNIYLKNIYLKNIYFKKIEFFNLKNILKIILFF